MQLTHSKCSIHNYHVSQRLYYENVDCIPPSRGYGIHHFLKVLVFHDRKPQHAFFVYMKYFLG